MKTAAFYSLHLFLMIKSFSFFRKDRFSNSGGLVVYCKNNLNSSRKIGLKSELVESICLEFKFQYSKPLLIYYTYRPPLSNVEWLTHFVDCLEKSHTESKETIVLGDVNFNLLKPNTCSNSWIQTMDNFSQFSRLVDKPTGISTNTSTLIDHVFTNYLNNTSVPCYAISDHLPVALTRIANSHVSKKIKVTTTFIIDL